MSSIQTSQPDKVRSSPFHEGSQVRNKSISDLIKLPGLSESMPKRYESYSPKVSNCHLLRYDSFESVSSEDISFEVTENETNKNIGQRYSFESKRLSVCFEEGAYIESMSHRTKRVLFVDDDDFILSILGSFALENEISFDCASNGEEALQKIIEATDKDGRCHYSLIVLDNHMPVMTGLELCEKLFAKAIHANIAIHSAESSQNEYSRFSQSGCKHFLKKPASWSEIQKQMEKDFD
eukprot:CAMPEP_0114991222 /NCGR_PEP_ID=MMETSP0216-20121206/11241_1 /TAXON_ID=223996 /ORGANISM="Protocruzia adherens, Strain Boccale" /LENGTH=236 /DNA_ID=CAMNT_0002354503 /DNA_START=40 /DNA_END=750 /DNA_ORIENTATION=+